MTMFAFLAVDSQAQQTSTGVAGPVAQQSPVASPAASPAAPAPAAKPTGPAPAAAPAAAPAQAPRPAASPSPTGLPRTGDADTSSVVWMTAIAGLVLLGGGLTLARMRR